MKLIICQYTKKFLWWEYDLEEIEEREIELEQHQMGSSLCLNICKTLGYIPKHIFVNDQEDITTNDIIEYNGHSATITKWDPHCTHSFDQINIVKANPNLK